jgi:hypothetical protein
MREMTDDELLDEVLHVDIKRSERGIMEYLTPFLRSVFRAHLGDTDPLRDLLLSDAPLSSEDRKNLAWLVDLKLRRRPVGRPRGSHSNTALADAFANIEDRVRHRRIRWLKDHPERRRLPKGMLDEIIRDEMERYLKRRPDLQDILYEVPIRDRITRGKRAKS